MSRSRVQVLALAAVALLLIGATRTAAPGPSAKRAPRPAPAPVAAAPQSGPSVAPLAPGQPVGWSHAPFEEGDCSICHERKDPKSPGKITQPVNELCYSCHEELKAVMERRQHRHGPAKKDCTACHNPHNAPVPKLLHQEMTALCFSCHELTQKEVEGARVAHLPVTDGDKCMNCHNPHASDVEQLLRMLPYDLCVTCHGLEDVRDIAGVRLANLKRVIDEGTVKHGPVASKDCSACHFPHGSANFRLLLEPYPAAFYASYAPENYALCFGCHKAELVRDAQTTTLTKFRDGNRNLHFVHVNSEEKGRTCRACHETHAARQPHLIRDAVPFGPRGWLLEVNFRPLPDGGQCAKTCHATKSYSRKAAVNPVAQEEKISRE